MVLLMAKTTEASDSIDQTRIVQVIEAMYAHAVAFRQAYRFEPSSQLSDGFSTLLCRPEAIWF